MNNNIDTAIIMAAGNGSRLKVNNIKPLTIVNDKPLIFNVIDNLLAAGILNIYIIKKEKDNLDVVLNRYHTSKVRIEFLNDSLGLGSLYSFSLIANIEVEWFVCADCDVICEKDEFVKMLNQGRERIDMGDLVGVVAEVTHPSREDKNMVLIEHGFAKRFVKQGIKLGSRGGYVYIFNKAVLNICQPLLDRKCFSLANYFDIVMQTYRIGVMQINDMWDIDTVEDIEFQDEKWKNMAARPL